MLPCMNKWMFGIDCPGCGMQRSIAFLLKGQFADAFFIFPAIYTSILFAAFIVLHLIDRSRNYTKTIIGLAVLNAAIMIFAYFYKITL